MATKVKIKSIKVTDADLGKKLTVNLNGEVEFLNGNPNYVALTAGTIGLNQSGAGDYQYNIADFEGTDLNTVNINIIYIQTNIYQHWDVSANAYIEITFPDGTDEKVHGFDRSNVGGPNVSERQIFMQAIPIANNQSTLDIHIEYGSEFTIIGATQVER